MIWTAEVKHSRFLDRKSNGVTRRLILCLIMLSTICIGGRTAQADGNCVDVALVLAIDSSASVSKEEFDLEQRGIAQAFHDNEVLQAIKDAESVAISALFWASETMPKPQTKWYVLRTSEDATVFADVIESVPRMVAGDTGLGAAMAAAILKLNELSVCARRQVINVTGDGEDTLLYRGKRVSMPPSQVRDEAAELNIEINALAISNDEKNLLEYYAKNVIIGPAAFVMRVDQYTDVARAIKRKLIREIRPQAVSALIR